MIRFCNIVFFKNVLQILVLFYSCYPIEPMYFKFGMLIKPLKIIIFCLREKLDYLAKNEIMSEN